MSLLDDVKAIVTVKSPSTVQDERFDGLVDLAKVQISECVFGNKYAYAVSLIVLHWLALDERGGASGSITSEDEGDLSRSYGNQGSGYYSTTSWGSEFERLKKSLVFSPMNRMMDAC
jgi:hypothetical protein